MLTSKARLILESFKSNSVLYVARYATVPQSVRNSTESSPVSKEKQKKEPFMKNIFLGKFHDDFLAFPVNKGIGESSKLHQLHSLFKEENSKNLSYKKLISSLAENGFFYVAVPQFHRDNITYSELVKFYEDLNLKPSLALLLEVQSSLVIPTIYNYGSQQQKEKYLKKLLSGEITGAYALCEENSGSDPSAINTSATEAEKDFVLNGEKWWVTNALNAGIYIVFANVLLNNLLTSNKEHVKDLSVFLVDRSENLLVKEHNLLGLSSCGVGKITFDGYSIPKDHLLCEFGDGFKIASEILTNHKFIILTSILSCLKNLTSILTAHVNKQKNSPQDLKDCELVKKKLADIGSVTYSLESMLYFTCNLLDNYIIDTSLESALLQIFGFEKAIHAVMECLELLGLRSYDKAFEFEELLCDFKGLKLFASGVEVTKFYASLIGLDHAGNALKEVVLRNRNPFNYPSYILKKIIRDRRFVSGSPKLTLKLYMNLHPALKASADQLELCILRFQHIVEMLLSRHGSEIVYRQVELKCISDIAVDIFAMTSVLCRASHSYCTGIQHCDQEVLLARAICYELFIRVKRNIEDITEVESVLNNSISLTIGETLLHNQSYFLQNPHKTCI